MSYIMSSESPNHLKCSDLQKVTIVIAVVLIMIITYHWWVNKTNTCLSTCSQAHQSCKASCAALPPMAQKPSSTISHFKPTGGKTKKMGTSISESELEHFSNNRYVAQSEVYDPATLALEKSVFDSHRSFTDDTYIVNQGPKSGLSVRDDTNDVNPRVGLRRTDYTKAFSSVDARTVSSETPEQIKQENAGKFII